MPNFIHKPVLVEEVLAALHPEDGGQYVDGTVGGAGHAAAILEACSPTGRLIGYDRDGTALEAAASRLSPFAGRFELRRGNFAQMAAEIPEGSCAGVLLDLGVSSPMLDCPERGFSFQQDGPLDMRMDQRQELTAAQLVNELPADELANILWELGDEQNSRRIARAIEQNRRAKPFERTSELASLIERVSPRGGRKAHPATKTFQALRIAVNDEIGSLKRGLDGALRILRPGGRLAVITFHSLEDRVVKEFGRLWSRDYEPGNGTDEPLLRRPRPARLNRIGSKAVLPGEQELLRNTRSRSAQLRVYEAIGQ